MTNLRLSPEGFGAIPAPAAILLSWLTQSQVHSETPRRARRQSWRSNFPRSNTVSRDCGQATKVVEPQLKVCSVNFCSGEVFTRTDRCSGRPCISTVSRSLIWLCTTTFQDWASPSFLECYCSLLAAASNCLWENDSIFNEKSSWWVIGTKLV